jgi:tetratricopeptide (TPR) repeat protein
LTVAIKDTLRILLEAGREKEASDLIPHVDDTRPSQAGRWTAKDNLAHLSAWRLIAAAELEAVRTGTPAPASVSEATDENNANVYEGTRNQRAAAVLEDARRSWATLASAVEACSEDELLKPRIRRPEQAAWQVIPGNTFFHIAEHLGYWNDERGEPDQSESAAVWAHDLASNTMPDERQRGTADYNLGCFYAVRGRAEDAVPYLRRGIELNPSLRDWAKTDSDLDSIRSRPELVRLLA